MAEPPHRVAPEGFDDAKEIADRFISGQAVVVAVGELDRETARRIIDFGSGMCYSNGGRLERIRESLYLLTPPAQSSTHPRIRTDHLSDRAARLYRRLARPDFQLRIGSSRTQCPLRRSDD